MSETARDRRVRDRQWALMEAEVSSLRAQAETQEALLVGFRAQAAAAGLGGPPRDRPFGIATWPVRDATTFSWLFMPMILDAVGLKYPPEWTFDLCDLPPEWGGWKDEFALEFEKKGFNAAWVEARFDSPSHLPAQLPPCSVSQAGYYFL